MTSKATEKIIDALTQLLEGFNELHESLEQEFGGGAGFDDDDDDDEDLDDESNPEVEAAMGTEIKAALEAVIEGEDFDPEEMANLISALTEALEEIDPTVFSHEEISGTDYVAETDDDDDDDDYDLDEEDDDDDYDLDEDEDDDELEYEDEDDDE